MVARRDCYGGIHELLHRSKAVIASGESCCLCHLGEWLLVNLFCAAEVFMSDGFTGSPEWEDRIESGGRDEDYSDYYQKWQRRVNRG